MTGRPGPSDERGAVAIMVALLMVVVCLAASFSIDLGNVTQIHQKGQDAVEDAALSGAALLAQGKALSTVVAATQTYVQQNYPGLTLSSWSTCPAGNAGPNFSPLAGSGNCVQFNAAASAVSVELPPQAVSYTVAQVAGLLGTTVEASAVAVVAPGSAPCALCVIGMTGTTLNVSGNGSVTDISSNAGIIVDSNGTGSTPAVQVTGSSASLTAPQIDVTGAVTGPSSDFSPQPVVGTPPVPDPLAFLPQPVAAAPAAILTDVSVGANQTVTLTPGNYGNISVGSNGTLIIEPGTYFITGLFSVTGTGSVLEPTGGSLLYFTCAISSLVTPCPPEGAAGGSLSLTGNGVVNLAPPTTGPYAGLTTFYDRKDTSQTTLNGNGSLTLSGTLYAQSSLLNLIGNGGTLSSLIVVGATTLSGNGGITVNYTPTKNIALPTSPFLCSASTPGC